MLNISLGVIAIFIAFVIFVAILYRLFKIAISALIVALIGFIFPWVNLWLGLGLPIPADIKTSLHFAGLAVLLFLAYQFFHYLIVFFKIVTWPIRFLLRRREKAKVKKIEKELKRLKKRSRS